MKLIEDIYTPRNLYELITPNYSDILEQINQHIKMNQMNLLCIGSTNTFKQIAMKLIIKEYYEYYLLDKKNENKNIDFFNDSEYVLFIDTFTDITFSNSINELNTFCRSTKSYKKCVFIDNFDIINESNQQYFKTLIDSSPNIFFLFGCENTTKINEIIQTRTTPIFFEDFTNNEYKILIERIIKGENIYIKNINILLEYSNLTIYYIFNLFNKLKILDLDKIEDITPYITLLENSILNDYIETVKTGDIKKSTQLLFGLYEKGYSLLDIYHFIYEYIKINKNIRGISYLFIEKICYYIEHIYNGYDNKLMLLFFTTELVEVYEKRDRKYYP
jgi:DNA polymerase III delta prime subunit